MNRTESYESHKPNMMKDVDTWLGNSLALIMVGLAVAAGVIGMLVAFEYINEGNTNPFEDGMVFLIGGVILAISANAFRREHHITDLDDRRLDPRR